MTENSHHGFTLTITQKEGRTIKEWLGLLLFCLIFLTPIVVIPILKTHEKEQPAVVTTSTVCIVATEVTP